MTAVIDIECPDCGRSKPLRKVDLSTYRCPECDVTFGREEAEP